ncbi:zinc finger protein, putative [Pediculus humanus corporis]|uniref:Zinc finger protein, putative n=1 Tax=Pediculus humanus subsp. corporis TaxID=121224 RepID=E0VUW4_PEDHC|nr:zinc finger protein, putative [Pediculus humanus corporis]EEB17170.1 zinc finger protein, putative [Pediculus humanus corporis]
MEDKNVEVSQVVKSIKSITVKEDTVSATHALGLQDLYNAAFSQEPDANTNEINIIDKGNVKILNGNDKVIENNETYKNSSFDDGYQLYSLKTLEYSIDFVKPDEQSVGLNSLNSFEDSKNEGKEVFVSSALSHPYETFQNVPNSVLDLDKGIQIHLVKTEDIQTESPNSSGNDIPLLTYNYENCGYSGDKNFDNESVGVNPETLGVRFEDCDFNSSDSFASTESIIPKNINCPKCPKKFMFKSDLLRHDKYKHSSKPKLFCKYCNKEFVSQQNLLFHEKSHKKKRNSLKCEICKKVFKKSAVLIKHMEKKHSKNTSLFFCTDCNKNFSTQNLLNNHIKKIHTSDSEKPYKCDICLKRFEKKQGLSCHVKAHTDEQQLYVCQHCNKSFSKICYLKNHLKSHQEDKDSFLCDICGKDYKSLTALEEHSRKHTGEKPFTCNVCMKSFAYKAYFIDLFLKKA